MPTPFRLFQLGQRGVDVVNKPQDLDESELVSGQNIEVSTSGGGGALDQRPGMTRIGNTPLAGAVLMAMDIPSQLLTDLTPYLYAGVYTSGVHNWRASSDGVTWVNVDTLVKPFSNNVNIALYAKNIPKAVTIGRLMYWADNNTPIRIHAWDGTTDTVVSTIPATVVGATLVTPTIAPADGYGFSAGVGVAGTGGSTTYVYKVVATFGASHSPATAALTYADGTTFTNGNATLDSTHYNVITTYNDGAGRHGVPPAGATAIDVYRVTGGATQGKIGTVPVVNGGFLSGNGSGLASGAGAADFTDGGLVGDGATPPSTSVGSSAANALAVLDMITDGSSIYLATLDNAGTDPNPVGRIFQFFPQTAFWSQIGLAFPIAAGNGTPAALVLFDGAITYGDYIGITAGNTSYVTGAGTPLPFGGIPEIHSTAASFAPTCIAGFNGELFVGTTCLTTTAAIVLKRTTAAVWSTSLTAGAAAAKNSYTTLSVFNGRLFAGWTSGGGATAANIYSTPDGITWTLERTLAATDVPAQMVTFNGNLYVVLGRTGIAYNTTSSILRRTAGGVWSVVDDPSDDFAGCLAVVYQ